MVIKESLTLPWQLTEQTGLKELGSPSISKKGLGI